MRLASCLAIFFLPILAGVLKHTAFGGTGPIWPFFLAACFIAAFWDWQSAALVAVGIGGAQLVEQSVAHPALSQFALYGLLGVLAIMAERSVAAAVMAFVSLLYFTVAIGALPWFPVVVATEFALTFGLIGVVANGPRGGRLRGRVDDGAVGVGVAVPVHQRSGAVLDGASPVAEDQGVARVPPVSGG